MKTIKKMLFVAMLLTVVTGYAKEFKNDNPNNVITTFKFLDVKKGHQLILKDHEGTVLHRETIKRDGVYWKKFDLTSLDDGLYSIELSKDFEIIVKPFQIKSNQVIFLDNEETKVFKPVVRVEDFQLLISQLALNADSLKVELFYNGELIHSDELKGRSILERVYSLSKTESGDYFIRMTSGERQFTKRFSL